MFLLQLEARLGPKFPLLSYDLEIQVGWSLLKIVPRVCVWSYLYLMVQIQDCGKLVVKTVSNCGELRLMCGFNLLQHSLKAQQLDG